MIKSRDLTLLFLILMFCSYAFSLKSKSIKVQRNEKKDKDHKKRIGDTYDDYCEAEEYSKHCKDNNLKLDNKKFEGKTMAEISHLFNSKQASLNLFPQELVIYDDQNEELQIELKKKADHQYQKGFDAGYDKCMTESDKNLLSGKNSFTQLESNQILTWLPIDWTTSPIFDGTVPNQGKCGSCWAFAAAESIVSNAAIKRQKFLPRLSVQELIDCVTEEVGLDGSCVSGSSSYAIYYVYLQGKEAFDASYPYIVSQNTTCNIYNLALSDFLIKPIYSYKVYATATETQMYNQLKLGPIAVSIAADTPAFLQYSSGILVLNNCASPTNHTVLLVGYGIDVATGKTYWLLKNFWGTNWGENGYFRLEYKKYTYPCPYFYKGVAFITAAP